MGTQLFAGVKWGANLNRQVNFKSFTRSFLFLLQVLTGGRASFAEFAPDSCHKHTNGLPATQGWHARALTCFSISVWALPAGENWRYTMNDLKVSPPYCTPGIEGNTDCGFKLGATLFFITFLLLQTYLLTNLFVAAILEYVASGLLRERLFLTPQHLDKYQVFCPSRVVYVSCLSACPCRCT